MRDKKWILFLQLNAESNLIQSMVDVFNTVKEEYKEDSQFHFAILLDGSINEHKDSGPKLYLINKDSSLDHPTMVFKNSDLSSSDNITTILNEVYQKTNSTSSVQLVYIIKDHGGGMDLLTNNKVYKHLDVLPAKTTTNRDEIIIAQLEEKYKSYYAGFEIETVFRWNNLFRILFSQDRSRTEYLSIAVVGQAIQSSTFKKAAILGIDSCWGQMFENALSVNNSCSYFIANEDQGPIAGFGYSVLFKYLMKVPHEMTPGEVVNAITASYILSNQQDYLTDEAFIKMGVCLSAIKTKPLEELVSQFNAICESLLKLLGDTEYKDQIVLDLFRTRIQCFDFLYDGPTPDANGEYCVFIIDLIHFFTLFNLRIAESHPELSNKILTFIVNLYDNLKVEKNNYREYDGQTYNVIAKGISFFFPLTLLHWEKSSMYLTPAEMNDAELPLHKQIIQKTKWPSVLAKYFSLQPPHVENTANEKFTKFMGERIFWVDAEENISDKLDLDFKNRYKFALNWITESYQTFNADFSDNSIHFLKQIKPSNTYE